MPTCKRPRTVLGASNRDVGSRKFVMYNAPTAARLLYFQDDPGQIFATRRTLIVNNGIDAGSRWRALNRIALISGEAEIAISLREKNAGNVRSPTEESSLLLCDSDGPSHVYSWNVAMVRHVESQVETLLIDKLAALEGELQIWSVPGLENLLGNLRLPSCLLRDRGGEIGLAMGGGRQAMREPDVQRGNDHPSRGNDYPGCRRGSTDGLVIFLQPDPERAPHRG